MKGNREAGGLYYKNGVMRQKSIINEVWVDCECD
jgi:hypothetical protein